MSKYVRFSQHAFFCKGPDTTTIRFYPCSMKTAKTTSKQK